MYNKVFSVGLHTIVGNFSYFKWTCSTKKDHFPYVFIDFYFIIICNVFAAVNTFCTCKNVGHFLFLITFKASNWYSSMRKHLNKYSFWGNMYSLYWYGCYRCRVKPFCQSRLPVLKCIISSISFHSFSWKYATCSGLLSLLSRGYCRQNKRP